MTRGRKRAASREHVDLDEKAVVGDDGVARSECRWSCKYCGGDDDGGIRKTVTFPASRFDVHLTTQCSKAPEEVKAVILARSLANALKGPEGELGDSPVAVGPGASPEGKGGRVSLDPMLQDVKPTVVGVAGVQPLMPPMPAQVAAVSDVVVTPPAPKRRKSKAGAGRASGVGVSSGVSDARKKSVGESIARFFAGTGLPLGLAATPLFQGMVKELDPAFSSAADHSVDFWYNDCLTRLHATTKMQSERKLTETGSYRTLSFDHFAAGEQLFVNFFESSPKTTLFSGCQEVGAVAAAEDSTFLNVAIEHLEKAGKEACSSPEDVFAGIVGSVGGCRDAAMASLAERYKRLSFVKCARQTLEQMLDEIFRVPEISQIVTNGHAVSAFANLPALVTPGHLSGWKSPDAHADSGALRPLDAFDLLSELLGKKAEIASLVEDEFKWDAAKAVSGEPVGAAAFEGFVRDPVGHGSIAQLVALLCPIARALRLIERSGCGLSWVIPLFGAILEDVTNWSRVAEGVSISSVVSAQIVATVIRLWTGTLRSPVHMFAWLMDPHTTPTPEELPDGFKDDFRSVLARLAPTNELNEADHVARGLNELESVILREGEWGKVITECQADVTMASCSPLVPENGATSLPKLTLTDGVLKKMEVAGDGSRKWRVYGSRQYGALRFGAVRVLSMCAVSGCVGNVRAGGLVDAIGSGEGGVGSRLSNEVVRKLIYVYVNSRLGLATADKRTLERGPCFDFIKEAMGLGGAGAGL